jgi:1,4-dihydroxy-6-naphthoate synthase
MRTLTLGYSPCPNDTFVFYALVHGKIDTDHLEFREILDDVETLNRLAGRSELDMTKASFHAFGHLRGKYCLLRAGGALGKGCGPLVIAREDYDMNDLKSKTIAIPGALTTAFLLLRIFDDTLKGNVRIMPFHRIIDAVGKGEVDAGLVIHESRFTYERAGLKKIIDLGEWWEKETGLPIPLGAILAKRELGYDLIHRIDRMLKKSVEYAFSRRKEPISYIKRYSQEMEDDVIESHIRLYVNNYSLDIGDDGTAAVKEIFKKAEERGIIEKSSMPFFIS